MISWTHEELDWGCGSIECYVRVSRVAPGPSSPRGSEEPNAVSGRSGVANPASSLLHLRKVVCNALKCQAINRRYVAVACQ